jgi:6-phosphogluconolactonase
MPEVDVLPDARSLVNRAAAHFIRLADEAIQHSGCFNVALSGGSTPKQLYAALTKQPLTGQVDWRRVHFFWGDERCVPPDHPDSNYRMAHENLLTHIPLPSENVYRIHGELSSDVAAHSYEDELRRMFVGKLPRFDLILLGLGEDGHTASLFPGTPAVREDVRWAVAVQHDSPPLPLVDRVTLTLPVLNAAREVIFLVSGAGKAERLAQVLNGPYNIDRMPAQAVKPESGRLRWLVDKAAASLLDWQA